MSGMIWDELQRLRAAIDRAEENVCCGGAAPFVREAFNALEEAIVEAWPPQERDDEDDEEAEERDRSDAGFKFKTSEITRPIHEIAAEAREQWRQGRAEREGQRIWWEATNEPRSAWPVQIIANGLNPPEPRYYAYDNGEVEHQTEEERRELGRRFKEALGQQVTIVDWSGRIEKSSPVEVIASGGSLPEIMALLKKPARQWTEADHARIDSIIGKDAYESKSWDEDKARYEAAVMAIIMKPERQWSEAERARINEAAVRRYAPLGPDLSVDQNALTAQQVAVRRSAPPGPVQPSEEEQRAVLDHLKTCGMKPEAEAMLRRWWKEEGQPESQGATWGMWGRRPDGS